MNVWFRLTLAINKMHNVAHFNFADGRKNSEKLGRISWFKEIISKIVLKIIKIKQHCYANYSFTRKIILANGNILYALNVHN